MTVHENLPVSSSGMPDRIPSLTPLRGVAALLVAVFHIGFYLPELRTPASTFLFRSGYLWVDFFFILSGFILAHVYGDFFKKSIASIEFRNFIWARFKRIYPLHLFVLLVYLAIIVFHITTQSDYFFPQIIVPNEPRFSPGSLLSNIFLLHSLHLHDYLNWNMQSWSISTEWYAYLLFPFLVLILHKSLLLKLFLVSGGLLALYALEKSYGHLSITVDLGFIRCLIEFVCGMTLYEAYRVNALKRWLQHDYVLLLLLLLIAVIMHFDSLSKVLLMPSFALLILSAAWAKGRLAQLLNCHFMRHLGNISYSIYMIHLLCIESVFALLWSWRSIDPQANWLLEFGLMFTMGFIIMLLILIISVASLTYYLVELPAKRYLSGLQRKQKPDKRLRQV